MSRANSEEEGKNEFREYKNEIIRKLNILHITRCVIGFISLSLLVLNLLNLGIIERFFQDTYRHPKVFGYYLSENLNAYFLGSMLVVFSLLLMLSYFTDVVKKRLVFFIFAKYVISDYYYDIIEDFYNRIKKEKIINLSFYIIVIISIFAFNKLLDGIVYSIGIT